MNFQFERNSPQNNARAHSPADASELVPFCSTATAALSLCRRQAASLKQWVRRAWHGVTGGELRTNELTALFLPWKHFPLIASRRAAMILSRVRLTAALFAVLTPAWGLVDVVAFSNGTATALVAGRFVAGTAFALLALMLRKSESVRSAQIALVSLYAIPTAFYVYSFGLLQSAQVGVYAQMMTAIYAFAPVIAVAGLSVFPLTALEVLVFAIPVFLGEAIARALHAEVLGLGTRVGVYWTLALVTGVSGLACMSQLAFVVALMGQSMRDRLTGCFSRASIQELLELQFLIATRSGAPLTVAFVDLDDFKSVNDRHGHEAGDAILAAAGERMRSALRRGDMTGRWGGEEFVIILPNSSLDQAVTAVEKLRAAGIGTRPDGRSVTASIGVAERTVEHAAHWRTLIDAADRRMYRAKLEGKNRLSTVDEAPFNPVSRRHERANGS